MMMMMMYIYLTYLKSPILYNTEQIQLIPFVFFNWI